MIYGNKFLPKEENNKSSFDDIYSESVIYTEYLERKSLLESCTDSDMIPVLEAQVQVLYEVSIKDIIEKIKEAYYKFKDWLYKMISKLIDILFKNKKDEKSEEAKKNIKSFFRDLAHDPLRDIDEIKKGLNNIKEHDWYEYTLRITSGEKTIKETAFDGRDIKKEVENIFMPYMKNFTEYQINVFKNNEGYKDDEADAMNREIKDIQFKGEKYKFKNDFHIGNTIESFNNFIDAMYNKFDISKNYDEAINWVENTTKNMKKMDSDIEEMIKKLPSVINTSNSTDIVVYNGSNVNIRSFGQALHFEIMYLQNISRAFDTMGKCLVRLRNAVIIQTNKLIAMLNAITIKQKTNHMDEDDYRFVEDDGTVN